MTIIQKHVKFYGNIAEIKQLQMLIVLLLILLQIILPFCLKLRIKITGERNNDGTKSVEIKVPIKYLNKFWRTLEVYLINCQISLILTCSKNCVIVSIPVANYGAMFPITETKLYVSVVTLSVQDNK